MGIEGAVTVVADLIQQATGESPAARVADLAELLMAGVDFPAEEEELRQAVVERGWADEVVVANDTFAVLRAGTERGWGVAVVCGAGINCVGVAPDGRQARFLALGPTTGDWGGGFDVGLAATSAAARSEDGRGPRTSLEHLVPAHFDLEKPSRLAKEIHRGTIPMRRLAELPPVVFAAAADDAVAAEIVDRLARGRRLSRVTLARLDLARQPVELLLGGGLLQAGDGRLMGSIEAGMREVAPAVSVHRAVSPPIVGAALRALDRLGAPPESTRAPARQGPRRRSGGEDTGWLTFASITRRRSIRARTRPQSTPSTSTWRTRSSSSWSALRAPGRRPPCGCSPASRRSMGDLHRRTGRDRLPPKKRDVAMVFQNYALYPYLTVEANIGFPLRIARVNKDERKRRVLEVAQLLGLEPFLARKPGQLSGGQRQRVAMGRAIVGPAAFLMDEPLSNLDAKLRVQMRADIAALQDRLGVTTVYVTHDQAEAMTLGDRVVVMGDGRVHQCGPPRELYEAPVNTFVAGFIGSPSMNLVTVPVEAGRLVLAGTRVALPPGAADNGRGELVPRLSPEAPTLRWTAFRPRSSSSRRSAPTYVFCVAEVAGEATKLVARADSRDAPNAGSAWR